MAAGVLVASAVFGLVWRARSGRLREVSGPADLHVDDQEPRSNAIDKAILDSVGVTPADATVTLLQFSSAFCAPCRATRVLLRDVAAKTDGVHHVEVDAESHLTAVRALDILRTPTLFVLDSAGRPVRRASGLPRREDVVAVVDDVIARAQAG